jgi:FkbM family methyltransferase
MDIWAISETWLNGIYEDPFLDLSTHPTVVIDIGGGIGDFTVRAAKLFPEARVYGYEPHPHSAALLRENVARNSCATVTVHERAVSGGAAEITLYLPQSRTALDSSTVQSRTPWGYV